MLPASFPRWLGLGLAAIAVCLAAPAKAKDAAPVIVHEWGTFTCLQDQNGGEIGGINVDDEPVPDFVWGIGGATVAAEYSADLRNFGLPPYLAGKGLAAGDPTVTMRLETPVLYIYPPAGKSAADVPPLTVHVDFYGGVLSQYYPYAVTNGLSLADGSTPYLKDGLSEITTTGLTWENVRLVDSGTPVQTDDQVWTAPREVKASLLQVPMPPAFIASDPKTTSQTEKFLFYRGIGHLDSPLRFTSSNPKKLTAVSDWMEFGSSWIVEVRPGGSCAFAAGALRAEQISLGVHFTSNLPKIFSDSDFHPNNLAKLKASMHDALVQAGLYPDEAAAMLKTWELSYFKSPGRRFFYIAPSDWVSDVLPLSVTGAPAKITRVMIGRIELVTDAQRAALQRLAAGPCPDLPALKQAAATLLESSKISAADKAAFYRGEKPLADLGIPIPPLLQDYLSLGRFRDALIVHENQLHPSPALAQFIATNHLGGG